MAYTITNVEVAHTQYLRQILTNVPPHHGETHNTRLWLAVGTYVQVGQYGSLAGWRQPSKEYLRGTKEQVTAVRSVGDALAVFTRSSIFLITGNSEQSWGVTKIDDEYGTVERDTIQVANGLIWWEETNGGVHVKVLTPDAAAACVNVHITMDTPASCFLYARPKERKALHFCVHGETETVLYRADPSALKQTALGAPFAPWFRIPLGTVMKHCWVSGGKLYAVDGDGMVHNLDNIEAPAADQPRMTVKLALPGAGGGRVTKMELITQDVEATITMDGPDNTLLMETVTEDLQIRNESGIRRFESQITTDDPSMAIVTYESDEIDAALLIARWSQERKQ